MLAGAVIPPVPRGLGNETDILSMIPIYIESGHWEGTHGTWGVKASRESGEETCTEGEAVLF